MMSKKTLLVASVIIIAIGLLIGGCAKSEVGTPIPSASRTPTPPASGTPVLPASGTPILPASGPQYGGTLRIICSADLTTMGWPSEQNTPEDWYQRTPALETLVHFDEKGITAPLLAESVAEDPKALTITFNLRHGVKFHDGTNFDADACIWNLEQARASADLSSSFIFASDIEKVDDYTVRVHFNSWDSTFLANLAYGPAMVSPTAYKQHGLDWMRENAVGTGPFKEVSFQRDVQKVFERFDGYWQKGKPYLDRIIINIIADPTVQVASFLNGDNDIITNLNPTDAKELKGKPGTVITQGNISGDTLSLVGDSINPDSPFSDIRVRQAVSYAINRKEISDFVYHGYAVPTFQMNGPACWSYNPNVVGYPYDPDKAKKLLAEAAMDGIFKPNPQGGFNTTIWCRSDLIYRDLFTAVQGYLAGVGIIADLQALNVGQYQEMYFGTGWSKGMFGADFVIGTDVGIFGNYMFSSQSTLAFAKMVAHPDEVEKAIGLTTSAPDFETNQAQCWNQQYLLTDKYCLYTPIIASYPIAAKSINVQGEQTSTVEASGFPWTFADAWLKQ